MNETIFQIFLVVLLSAYIGLFVFRGHGVLVFRQTKVKLEKVRSEVLAIGKSRTWSDERIDLERRIFDESWIPFLETMNSQFLSISPYRPIAEWQMLKKCRVLLRSARFPIDEKPNPLNLETINDVSK